MKGKHLEEDVNERILNLLKNSSKEVVLIDKLSLVNEIFPTILNIISHKYSEKFDVLITSCSFSKNNKVKKELEVYTNKLSFSLKIPKKIFHFVGDEKKVFKELNNLGNHSNKILLHPVFFLVGIYTIKISTLSQRFSKQ